MPDSNNKTEFFTITLYPSEYEPVTVLSKNKNFNFSETIRFIINDYFSKDNKQLKKDFFFYLFYPLALMVISLVVNISTEKVFNTLLEKGIYFNELYILSKFFLILSFLSIGIFMASIYLFRAKYKED